MRMTPAYYKCSCGLQVKSMNWEEDCHKCHIPMRIVPGIWDKDI